MSERICRAVQGGNLHKKRRSNSNYIGDPQLFRRVNKYVDDKTGQDVIDKETMIEDLRNQYKEYGRRNKSAFRNAVFKAFDIIMQATMADSGGSDVDESSEESIMEEDTFLDIGAFNNRELARNNGPIPYLKVIQNMTNSNNRCADSEELINISSSDEEGGELQNKLPGKRVDSQISRINLPVGSRLITGPLAESLLIKKRKTYDFPSEIQIFKKSKTDVKSIPSTTFKDFGGSPELIKSICQLIIHMRHPEIYRKLGVTPPRGFLLHGPPGSGKTLLANVIAGELKMPLIKVAAPELVGGVSGESELRIRDLFEKAKTQMPCVLFIDEVDSITRRRDTAQKDMERRIVSQLLMSLDELSESVENDRILIIGATNQPDTLDPALRRAGRFDREICLGIPNRETRESILRVICKGLRLSPSVSLKKLSSLSPGYVGADLKALLSEAAIAAVNRVMENRKEENLLPNVVDSSCENSGNQNIVDKEIQEVSNNTAGKTAENETKSNSTIGGENPVADVETIQMDVEEVNDSGKDVQNTPGEKSDETDKTKKKKIEEIIKPTETSRREPLLNKKQDEEGKNDVVFVCDDFRIKSILTETPTLTEKELEDLYIEEADFIMALKTVQPSAKREGFATVPDVTWDDIGSLKDIRDELQMSILMPVKYPEEFSKLAISLCTGILLCGPPGCGKTLLAKAVANEANINFISVKGPELLNMYVGESERAVRQCFQRARNSHPCVIFFDELDALCPRRSDVIEGGASSRVVNQLLTEMDGVEGRSDGVYLMAATNRPDMVDPAVMRPGRFDKLLYVGLPSPEERVEILMAITKNGKKPPMDADVDLDSIGKSKECNGFTGADLSALIKEASVQALSEHITKGDLKGDLFVGKPHILKAFSKIRPSISEKELKRYDIMRRQYTITKEHHL